jgi:hypothetical protein
LRTIRIQFDAMQPSRALIQDLAAILGTPLDWKLGAAEWRTKGLYVAIQTARYIPSKLPQEGVLRDTTSETRETLQRIVTLPNP